MDKKELIQIIKDNGVVGAGGAGFPTYAKIDERTEIIILNCAECEPLLKLHRQLLQNHAYEILSTLDLIGKAVGAKQVIIGIKEAYAGAVEAVKAFIGSFSNMELGLLPEVYPAGDEVVLIYETTQKVVPPGSIPIEIGVTVFNVETIYNVYKGIKNEGAVYEKYITVAGEVVNPITLKVPLGISVQEVVAYAGGVTIEDPAYISGGPMTGRIVSGMDVITKTSNAILVMPKNHLLIESQNQRASTSLKRAMASCCQCEMCTDLCPRNLLGHPITPHMFMRAATSGATDQVDTFVNTMFCCSCGICELFACQQGLMPRTLIGIYKGGLKKNGVAVPKGIEAKPVKESREYRRVPMERLISRLGLKKYDKAALYEDIKITPKSVQILLNQHIGAPSVPIVKEGDVVEQGQLIALAKENALSVPLHASISGMVIAVKEQFIIIKK